MVNKYVSCFLPSGNNTLKSKSLRVPDSEKTIYDAMGFFEDQIDARVNLEYYRARITRDIRIVDIINLHDKAGINIKKIKKMVKDIGNGDSIISKHGIPNIKIIKTRDNKILLFDGHHTMLSYLFSGKSLLSQIPHMMIESDERYFEDDEISVFFGNHKNKIKKNNWRDYVINWNEKGSKQIQNRTCNNIGELSNSISFS